MSNNQINNPLLKIAVVFGFIVVITFLLFAFEGVDDGHVAVKYNKWSGKTDSVVVPQGKWNYVGFTSTLYEYNTRLRNRQTTMRAQSANGLPIVMNITVRYQVDGKMTPYIFQNITREDSELADNFIIPELSSISRDVVRQYTDEEIYKGSRERVQGKMFKQLEKRLSPMGIKVDAVLLREVMLPKSQMEAIEKKQKANQKFQTTEFELKIAKKNAERKKIEASGQAEANQILRQSLSPEIIEYERLLVTREQIEAYKEVYGKLSNSPNSKLIISGSGEQPFIVNPN